MRRAFIAIGICLCLVCVVSVHPAISAKKRIVWGKCLGRLGARVFYTKKDLLDAIEARQIQKGDMVVLPFQGPLGAPGMPEMLTPTDAINGAGYKKVALITDGRFSSATTGPCIGHVEMEAFNGGTYRGYTGW